MALNVSRCTVQFSIASRGIEASEFLPKQALISVILSRRPSHTVSTLYNTMFWLREGGRGGIAKIGAFGMFCAKCCKS